jgi:hypothetical protein
MSWNPEGSGSRRHSLLKLLLAACACSLVQACTVVRIDNRDGSTTVSYRAGFVSVQPGTASTFIRVTSFGFHTAAGTSVVGFGHTEAATVAPGTCELILWGASPDTATAFRELFGRNVSVCTQNNLQAKEGESP